MASDDDLDSEMLAMSEGALTLGAGIWGEQLESLFDFADN